MVAILEVLVSVIVVGIFAELAAGPQFRRMLRRDRKHRSRPKTRPTIPHLVGIPSTREW